VAVSRLLRITIELRHALGGPPRVLGVCDITNLGDHPDRPTMGNYYYSIKDASGRRWRQGFVQNFKREKLGSWDLLFRALFIEFRDRSELPR
jgi:hypothetical protein